MVRSLETRSATGSSARPGWWSGLDRLYHAGLGREPELVPKWSRQARTPVTGVVSTGSTTRCRVGHAAVVRQAQPVRECQVLAASVLS